MAHVLAHHCMVAAFSTPLTIESVALLAPGFGEGPLMLGLVGATGLENMSLFCCASIALLA